MDPIYGNKAIIALHKTTDVSHMKPEEMEESLIVEEFGQAPPPPSATPNKPHKQKAKQQKSKGTGML